MAEDPLAPMDSSVREFNNYRRRVSRLVFRSLIQERSKRLKASLTQAEAEEITKAATNNTMGDILRRAREMSELQSDNEPTPRMLPEGGFEANFSKSPPEPDPTMQRLPADGLFVRDTDEGTVEQSYRPEIPYTSYVRLTMELLLNFHSQHLVVGSSILPRHRVNDKLKCSQCQEEPYLNDSYRDRVWPSKPHSSENAKTYSFHFWIRVDWLPF